MDFRRKRQIKYNDLVKIIDFNYFYSKASIFKEKD